MVVISPKQSLGPVTRFAEFPWIPASTETTYEGA